MLVISHSANFAGFSLQNIPVKQACFCPIFVETVKVPRRAKKSVKSEKVKAREALIVN